MDEDKFLRSQLPLNIPLLNSMNMNADSNYHTIDMSVRVPPKTLKRAKRVNIKMTHIIGNNEPNRSFSNAEESHHSSILDSVKRYCQIISPSQELPTEEGGKRGRVSWCPPPLVMISLSIIQIVFFYMDSGRCIKYNQCICRNQSPAVGRIFTFRTERIFELWRYVTYMLVHTSELHLWSNILFQIILGVPLEMAHSWWRVSLVYLIGVATGPFLSLLCTAYDCIAGASGGVYALLAGHLAAVIINFAEMEYAALQQVSIVVCCLAKAVTDHMHATIGTEGRIKRTAGIHVNISTEAHIGGIVGGLLTGVFILRNLIVHKWERVLSYVSFTCFWCIILFCITVFCLGPENFKLVGLCGFLRNGTFQPQLTTAAVTTIP